MTEAHQDPGSVITSRLLDEMSVGSGPEGKRHGGMIIRLVLIGVFVGSVTFVLGSIVTSMISSRMSAAIVITETGVRQIGPNTFGVSFEAQRSKTCEASIERSLIRDTSLKGETHFTREQIIPVENWPLPPLPPGVLRHIEEIIAVPDHIPSGNWILREMVFDHCGVIPWLGSPPREIDHSLFINNGT